MHLDQDVIRTGRRLVDLDDLNVCGTGFQLAGGNAAFMPTGSPQAAQQQQMQKDMEDLMGRKIPHYKSWQYFGLSLGLLSGTVMLASGIGLLKMRPWARRLTIIYACYNILNTIVTVVIASPLRIASTTD